MNHTRCTLNALFLALCTLVAGCGGSSGGSTSASEVIAAGSVAPDPTVPDTRFERAAELTDAWCIEAFRRVSGFNEQTLPDAEILNDRYEGFTRFSGAKSIVDAARDVPVELRSFVRPWCMSELPAPDTLSETIYCKMPSQARVADILGRTPDAETGTCQEANQAAFTWAWAQLSDEEQLEFRARGHSVEFLQDQVVTRGGDWLPLAPHFTPVDSGAFGLAAPSLQTEYVPGGASDTLDGVHYCTLVSPEQALYWLLHRGLKEDPGKCVPEEACLEPDVEPEGSCVFYFGATFTHMCEEYRGPYWDQALSEEKCASREGAYSTARCFERAEEIAILDSDDGGFIGTCDIACGQEERIWFMFSRPPNTDPANEACFTPAEGHPLLRSAASP